MGSFEADITKFVRKTGIRATLVLRKVALEGLKSVVMKSPVDTGRFRGNWVVGINKTNFEEKIEDPTGGVTIAEGQRKINEAEFGQQIVISNNLPYAVPLERGHSKQAPQGVLAITFAEIKAYFAQLVKAVQ